MTVSNDRTLTAHFRLAPTPSGLLHTGNAASFVLTWILARQVGGNILLRIDDLDRDRFRMEYLEDIFRTIDWLGIDYDRGPSGPDDFLDSWSQHHRIQSYMKLLFLIQESARIYECSCSRSLIANGDGCRCYSSGPASSEPISWRFHTSELGTIGFNDLFKGRIECDLKSASGDFVVRKKDGLPSYQVASLCDDIDFGITHVVRGEDLIPSTAAQLALDAELNSNKFQDSTILHHPLLVDPEGSKLSKSAGARALLKKGRNRGQQTEIIQLVAQWLGVDESIGSLDELLDASRGICRTLLQVQPNVK